MKDLKRRNQHNSSTSLPTFVPPQLSLLVKAPPTGENWAHELKYDDFRFHARIDRGRVKLLTRTGLDWTDKYANTAAAIGKIKARNAYIDGELCAVNPATFAEPSSDGFQEHQSSGLLCVRPPAKEVHR